MLGGVKSNNREWYARSAAKCGHQETDLLFSADVAAGEPESEGIERIEDRWRENLR